MKSPKERVQEYVREQIPALKELSRGCIVKNESRFNERLFVLGEEYEQVLHWNDEIKEARLLDADNLKIIGHPIQLHHYLAVLGDSFAVDGSGYLLFFVDGEWTNVGNGNDLMQFSLTTGQPATEKDWEIMSNILGV